MIKFAVQPQEAEEGDTVDGDWQRGARGEKRRGEGDIYFVLCWPDEI
jgi:hypothetical protein